MTSARALAATIALCGGAMLGCGGGKAKGTTVSATAVTGPVTVADRLLALLPEGAQLVIEIDLARLRANPVIGAVVTEAVAGATFELPGDVPASPLAAADTIVLAAYGVGTVHAATVTLLAASQPIPDAVQIRDGVYALGPTEWIGQIEQRAVLSLGDTVIAAEPALLALRDRAMPDGAPGASLRITARLPFDARVALARQTGLESAPAQLSVWADVVDDFAIVIDADAADPGDKAVKRAAARLEAMIRAALAAVAAEPAIRALGLPSSLARAKLVSHGTWIRTIVAVGPAHLQRVVDRATRLLRTTTPPATPATPAPPATPATPATTPPATPATPGTAATPSS